MVHAWARGGHLGGPLACGFPHLAVSACLAWWISRVPFWSHATPAAQPRALFAGHLGGAFIGITRYRCFGDAPWVYALAQVLTLGYMLLTNVRRQLKFARISNCR